MSRPLRIEFENAFYHVMNRGRGRQVVFPGRAYFEDYQKCIGDANKRFGIEIHAYCLMNNHYHLLLKTPRGNLGRAMRHIDGVYTQRHNRRKQTDGPLFRGRYKAIVVDADHYLLQVSRYIHRNPAELNQPLVRNLEDYPWSSFAAYVNKGKVENWLNRDTVYQVLGNAQRYKAYKAFVEQGNDSATERFYRSKYIPSIWGSKSFKAQARRQAQSLIREIDKKGLKQPVALEKIIRAVAAFYGLLTDEIGTTSRGRGRKNIPRWVAMKLCQEVGAAKLSEIADAFHVGHYSTVSQTIGRLNCLLLHDARVTRDFKLLSRNLTAFEEERDAG